MKRMRSHASPPLNAISRLQSLTSRRAKSIRQQPVNAADDRGGIERGEHAHNERNANKVANKRSGITMTVAPDRHESTQSQQQKPGGNRQPNPTPIDD